MTLEAQSTEAPERDLAELAELALDVEQRALIEEAKRIRAAMDAADARIAESGDALIVRLLVPIEVDGDELARLTLGPVRVRHTRAVRGERDNAGMTERYADLLVEPQGAFDELTCEEDYIAVCRAVERQLGKFREGGRPS